MVSTSDLQKWQTATAGINESGQIDLTQEEWAALITLSNSLQTGNFESDESRHALILLKNNLSRHSNNLILQMHLQNFIALCEQYADTITAKTTMPIVNTTTQPVKTSNANTDKSKRENNKKWILIAAALIIGYLAYSNWESLMNKMFEIETTSDDENKELLAEIVIGGKTGCINQKGELVIPAIYERMGIWSEGVASVMLNALDGKLGFIDTKGKQIIPLIYDLYYLELMPFFSEGIVTVSRNNVWGFIDRTGKEVIPFCYQRAEPFREGLAAVKKDYKWGFIDKSGNTVIECNYESATSFSEGFAIVNYKSYMNQLDNWQIIDMVGNEIHKIYNQTYYCTGIFSEGLTAVLSKKNRSYFNDEFKFGFIDTAGNEVVSVKYDYYIEGEDYILYPYFSEGLARVSKGKDFFVLKYGFVDKTGKEVIPLKYDYATDFSEGLAVVMLNDKYGFINQNGEEVIPLIYDRVYFAEGVDKHTCFKEGLAAVQKNEKWGFIDRTGKTAIPFQYDYANDFYEGLAYTSEGFIDKTGKVVIAKSLLQTYTNDPINSYSLGNFVNVKKRK